MTLSSLRLPRRSTLLVLLSVPSILLFAASCRTTSLAPPPPVQQIVAKNEFLGNDACAECHKAEFNTHVHSRHALALRTMDRESLGSQAPEPGGLGDSGYELTSNGSGYGF